MTVGLVGAPSGGAEFGSLIFKLSCFHVLNIQIMQVECFIAGIKILMSGFANCLLKENLEKKCSQSHFYFVKSSINGKNKTIHDVSDY